MTLRFGITWDYRCPFARIAHEHVLEGLADGADWDVRFVPFSLGQAHVEPGQPDVWDQPERDSGLLALQLGVSVRDHQPGAFLAAHRALFDARHVHGRDLRDRAALVDVLTGAGADGDAALADVEGGGPLATIRAEHQGAADELEVWGVPTFLVGDHAAFVRLMAAPDGDAGLARRTVERIVDAVGGWPELNELKHTSLAR
jgi:hypothetical protein